MKMPKPKAKPKKVSDSTRVVGPEGQGSTGDAKDRARDWYKPGAHPPPEPGLKIPDWMKPGRRKPKAKKP